MGLCRAREATAFITPFPDSRVAGAYEQLHRNAEDPRDVAEDRDIREAVAALVAADRLTGEVQPVSELRLGHVGGFAEIREEGAEFSGVKHNDNLLPFRDGTAPENHCPRRPVCGIIIS